MIQFENVQKKYSEDFLAIEQAHFTIHEGEFVLLAGPSGAGKSTLMKMLYKAEKPTKGSIYMFNENIQKIKTKKLRRKVGIVFQDFENYLLKNKTAYENIAYVLESQGKSPFKIKKMVMEALTKLGIEDKAHQKPYALSGGEKQRVAIARAIVNQPKVILCDEPTGNLDADNAQSVMQYLNDLHQQGTTILMSTHNESFLEDKEKRILYVENGEIKEKDITESTSTREGS